MEPAAAQHWAEQHVCVYTWGTLLCGDVVLHWVRRRPQVQKYPHQDSQRIHGNEVEEMMQVVLVSHKMVKWRHSVD